MALISTSCSPTTETLQLLRFADLAEGDLRLTADGILFAGLGVDERKALFARHLATYVPLAAHIKRILDEDQITCQRIRPIKQSGQSSTGRATVSYFHMMKRQEF